MLAEETSLRRVSLLCQARSPVLTVSVAPVIFGLDVVRDTADARRALRPGSALDRS